MPRQNSHAWIVALFLLGAAVPAGVHGQDVAPEAMSMPDGATIVAAGLTNPRGFVWNADGALYVALAGNGGMATNPEPPAPADAPPAADATPDLVADSADVLVADNSGAVVEIVNGCPVDFAMGFPSYNFLPLNWADGVIDVTMLDGDLYALVDGGGEAVLHPDEPNGVYRILADGTAELVADLSAWFRANPVANATRDISPDAQPYALMAGDGMLWVSESNHEQILTVTPDGTISRFIDLSTDDIFGITVPTGLAPAPDGGIFVSFLTELPFPDGAARVIENAPDGTFSEVWSGLTAVTDIAVGPDGTLFAVELATGNTDTEPFYHPNTGKIVRQTGPDSSEEVAAGLDFPVHIGFAPDGALYVSGPAFGANGGEGTIVRIDPAAAPTALPDLSGDTDCG
jgi:hypothetical protein